MIEETLINLPSSLSENGEDLINLPRSLSEDYGVAPAACSSTTCMACMVPSETCGVCMGGNTQYPCQNGTACMTAAETCVPAAMACGSSCMNACQLSAQSCTTTCQKACQTACESSCQTSCEVANQVIHKTLVSGTAYTIEKGNVLVNGTGYGLSKGRTLVGGTGYDIPLKNVLTIYDGTFRVGEFSYATFRSGGATSSTSPSVSTNGTITATSVYQVNPYNPDASCIWFYILNIGTIDVTNYTSLHFEIASGAVNAVFGLSTVKATSSNYNSLDGGKIIPISTVSGNSITYPYDATMDISGKTGSYYIVMYSQLSSMVISKIWLE